MTIIIGNFLNLNIARLATQSMAFKLYENYYSIS